VLFVTSDRFVVACKLLPVVTCDVPRDTEICVSFVNSTITAWCVNLVVAFVVLAVAFVVDVVAFVVVAEVVLVGVVFRLLTDSDAENVLVVLARSVIVCVSEGLSDAVVVVVAFYEISCVVDG
jgi:hypothetical protein